MQNKDFPGQNLDPQRLATTAAPIAAALAGAWCEKGKIDPSMVGQIAIMAVGIAASVLEASHVAGAKHVR